MCAFGIGERMHTHTPINEDKHAEIKGFRQTDNICNNVYSKIIGLQILDGRITIPAVEGDISLDSPLKNNSNFSEQGSESLREWGRKNKIWKSYWDQRDEHRRRSLFYRYAREYFLYIIEDCKLDGDKFGDVVRCYREWLADRDNKYIELAPINQENEKHLFIRVKHRFRPEYKKALRKKLKSLDVIKWDLAITYTIDPKKFEGLSLNSEYQFEGYFWNKLIAWIKKRYGNVLFLRVAEITKKGRIHGHVLLKFVQCKRMPYIPQKKLSAMCDKYGGGACVWVEKVRNAKASDYVLKYLTKGLREGGNELQERNEAIFFATNKRFFSVSKELSKLLHGKKVEKGEVAYRYVRMAEGYLIARVLGAKNDELSDYIILEGAVLSDYLDWIALDEYYGDG